MGMLLTYRRGYWPDGQEPKPGKRRGRKSKVNRQAEKPAEPEAPISPYADLTDEQVAEAYATNVGEAAEGRDAQVAALEALDAEANPSE